MNVFATYSDPVKSARSLDDQRVVKMTTESYQMLSTALRLKGYSSKLLNEITHPGHPCCVWVRERRENFEWLYEHMLALDDERMQRWGRDKHSLSVQKALKFKVIKYAREFPRGWTEWSNSARHRKLGLDFTHLPVHQAYRQYLIARWRLQQQQFEQPDSRVRLPRCTVIGLLR